MCDLCRTIDDYPLLFLLAHGTIIKESRVAKDLQATLQREVIAPWHEAVKAWLLTLGETAPAADELPGLIEAQCAPGKGKCEAALHKFAHQAANAGGQLGIDKIVRRLPKALKSDFTFNLRDPKLLEAIQQRGTKITGEVTDTMREDLRRVLSSQFYDEGVGPVALRDSIDDIFPETYANRAENIARTETLIAQATTQHECYDRNGVEKEQWLTLMDEKTRDDHSDMQGEVVALGEAFSNGLMYPGDPAGDAAEICNCRCDTLPVFGEGYDLPEQPWLGGDE